MVSRWRSQSTWADSCKDAMVAQSARSSNVQRARTKVAITRGESSIQVRRADFTSSFKYSMGVELISMWSTIDTISLDRSKVFRQKHVHASLPWNLIGTHQNMHILAPASVSSVCEGHSKIFPSGSSNSRERTQVQFPTKIHQILFTFFLNASSPQQILKASKWPKMKSLQLLHHLLQGIYRVKNSSEFVHFFDARFSYSQICEATGATLAELDTRRWLPGGETVAG
jgi:hypothetical protein